MQPLPHPSVSPLPSFASMPTVRRSPSFGETLGAVLRWMIGRQRQPSLRERFKTARLIDQIAEELDSNGLDSTESSAASPASPGKGRKT
jgi:hypothetical protein